MPSRLSNLFEKVKTPLGSAKSAKSSITSKNHVATPAASERATVLDKEFDKKERQHRREVDQMKREKDIARLHDQDPSKDRYGVIPHNGEPIFEHLERETFSHIPRDIGDIVFFRARVERIRPMSPKLAFVILRQQMITIQGVLRATHDGDQPVDDEQVGVSELMVRWVEKLPKETIVLVQGRVREAEQTVKSVEVHDLEIDLLRIHVLSEVTDSPPWTVADATLPADIHDEDGEHAAATGRVGGLALQSRLAHRAVDLRTPANQAIFRLQALVCSSARNFLDELGFIEIHTAKLQPAATESGSSVFKVDYFGRAAFLAQSPQLSKETCISADFERVYEIGPVFRAENSNTHRHMTEFTGIDLEMVIEKSYIEARTIIDGMLKAIFKVLMSDKYVHLRDAVKKQYPHDDLVFPEETVVLPFPDGIALLRQSGWKEEDGSEIDEYDDLSRKAEVRLGQLVKEKFKTDYFILDKFPTDVRPFYTMPSPEDPRYSNSFDIFVRGEEILSGGQRLHSARELEKRLEDADVDAEGMKDYLNAFKWGMPPHAGGGIGLERLVMLIFRLGNLRNSSLFPRDPRSFPDANPLKGSVISNLVVLPHVDNVVGFDEPTVLSEDPMRVDSHPALEDLIAEFGDSTNTAWTDAGYQVWRYAKSGAAIGYKSAKGHAISWGIPLCNSEELQDVIRAYIDWLEEHKLKPIWLNVDAATEKILAEEYGWRALTVTSDQRIVLSEPSASGDKNVQRKVRAAERAGSYAEMLKGEIPEALRQEIDEAIIAWQSHREGTQIHTTSVRPWADCKHRTYFIARDKDEKLTGLLTLAKLSPKYGYQIKWSLEFPNAPPGTSEFLLHHVIGEMRSAGVACATFGAGANDNIEVVDNIKGIRAKVMSQVYKAIVSSFSLTNKSRYREKFGAYPDSLYVCYKEGSLGFGGVEAIMRTVKDTGNKRKSGVNGQSAHSPGGSVRNSLDSDVTKVTNGSRATQDTLMKKLHIIKNSTTAP